MNMKNRMKGWLAIAIFTVLPGMLFAETQITHLRVQDSVEPLAIEDSHPLFSWMMESDATGQYQQLIASLYAVKATAK